MPVLVYIFFYYITSPQFADVISKNDGLKTVVSVGLVEPLVYTTGMVVG